MNRETQASAFGGSVAEQKVLEQFVVVRVWHASADPAGVGLLYLCAWRIAEVERTQIGHFEFLGDRSAGFLALERRRYDLGQICVEGWRSRGHPDSIEITAANCVLQREEGFPIR